MRQLQISIALLNGVTGVVIFFAAQLFYDTVPDVRMTDPFDLHFIRDAGLAYFGSGVLLALAWRREQYALALGGPSGPVCRGRSISSVGASSPLPRSTSDDSIHAKCGPEELSPSEAGRCRLRYIAGFSRKISRSGGKPIKNLKLKGMGLSVATRSNSAPSTGTAM